MLQSGAQRIMEQDLDFTISSDSGDELGQLCAAFEKMRGQLQKNNRELWRQAEERRRLNAAFSHDLRNPVTVLKGSVRLMEKSLAPDNLPPENIRKNLAQMSRYTERIADYIEVMSSAQRLEDTPAFPKRFPSERSGPVFRRVRDCCCRIAASVLSLPFTAATARLSGWTKRFFPPSLKIC